MFKYFPHTADDIRHMLDVIGMKSLEELYADVPQSVRLQGDYDIPDAQSELEIRRLFARLGAENQQKVCFAGAGVYDHYIPSAVPQICSRSEFLTSYTPYQAEISQGTLHYIFEYQTMMARLTGMEVSNASMYDGSTATAEAMMMAVASVRKSDKVLVSETLDPKVLEVMRTYAHFQGTEIQLIPQSNGATDFSKLPQLLAQGGVAGVVVQQPNYYGIVEDFTGVAEMCHGQKALMIVNAIAADLALLKSPGEWGADIAVGEAQSLGLPMAWGGPYLGYMCTSEKHMRKMPGRIVGQTVDEKGQRVFALTLQAREQHIRREKATSNICSNESLMALWVTIYMSLMGKQGLRDAAQMGCDGAHYLQAELLKTGRFHEAFPGREFLNEFCVKYDGDLDALQQTWLEHGFLGGIKVSSDTLMLAVTEQRSKDEIDQLVALAK
ncbi:MAG: aminomethyl-transferring glycine dehydrogenase subunit GcvPA [Prevotella sp.]|nr:aminomethyl-transferring glycine dehydrogenase subunit GcvPA [Prevotella sp.]